MRNPPRKQSGQKTGARRFSGQMLDVRGAASLFGTSEKTIRSRAASHLIPFRRFGGRLIFLRNELELFLESLPGIGVDEARANGEARRGEQ
jgi:hypothetical protein